MRRLQVFGNPVLFRLLSDPGLRRTAFGLESLLQRVRTRLARTPLPHTSTALLRAMQEVAPPGQRKLSRTASRRLRELTGALLRAEGAGAASTYQQFDAVRERGLDLPHDRLRKALSGKTVLVTGGTGCIGSALLEALQQYAPAALVSLSRGVSPKFRAVSGVQYVYSDVRDEEAMRRLFRAWQPDVIYHLAAQRSPSLAEVEVQRTLTTNILGTRAVVRAAEDAGVPQMVYASTGKALRPFTSDVYAASKKAGEWLVALAAERGRLRASAVRFTHVVDNSLFVDRLKRWIRTGGPVRLHGPEVAFFVQSARESSQVLLDATLGSRDGILRMHALRNLGWPVNLLDLSLGAMQAARKVVPLYFCGFEKGYEEKPFAGLYDPLTAGSLSPLVSALEGPTAAPSETCPEVDVFSLPAAREEDMAQPFAGLAHACAGDSDQARRLALEEFSWELLRGNLELVPRRTVERLSRWLAGQSQEMCQEHQLITLALHRAAQLRIGA